MSKIQIVFTLTFLFIALLCETAEAKGKIILTSCARMDTPIIGKLADGACISSCKFQNCATGNCKKRKGRPVCACSRCDKGSG